MNQEERQIKRFQDAVAAVKEDNERLNARTEMQLKELSQRFSKLEGSVHTLMEGVENVKQVLKQLVLSGQVPLRDQHGNTNDAVITVCKAHKLNLNELVRTCDSAIHMRVTEMKLVLPSSSLGFDGDPPILGSGGFSTVVEARLGDKLVAFKRLTPASSSAHDLDRVKRELEHETYVMAQMGECSNIAPVHGEALGH